MRDAYILSNLGRALYRRYETTRDLADLDEAARVWQDAADAAPDGSAIHTSCLVHLGNVARSRFAEHRVASDGEQAIALYRRAAAAMGTRDPGLPAVLSNLGMALEDRYLLTGDEAAYAEASDVLRHAVDVETAPADKRLQAAYLRGQIAAAAGRWPAAVEAYEVAIELLPLLAWHGLRRRDQELRLASWPAIASDAAACAIRAGDPERAVELVEHGRGVLFARALESRTELADLAVIAPALAERLAQVREELDERHAREPAGEPSNSGDWVDRSHELAREWSDLVARARRLPDMEQFLRPLPFGRLRHAARDGPVIIVNVSAIGSDALVVGAAGVRAVSLDALTPEAVMQHAAGFLDAVDALTSGPPAGAASARARMSEVLAWLWHALAEPVLTELGLTRPRRAPGRSPRVWWCPTGLLTFLPLHAAGTSGANTVLDRAVSSYTPGLLALARARDRARPPAERARLLTVAMRETPGLSPLHGAQEETGPLRRFRGDALDGAAATKAAVTSALREHAWVHFACHGGQDPSDPSRGRVFLHDHREDPLTVLDIGRLELPDAEFAFLSACETARGGVRLPDESLHLAAALQLAGYAHVIASLWPISDELAVEVTASVYATIESRGGLDPARSALALHEAVHTLRKSHEHPVLWAAYVHFGP